jgi:hypothetical protein
MNSELLVSELIKNTFCSQIQSKIHFEFLHTAVTSRMHKRKCGPFCVSLSVGNVTLNVYINELDLGLLHL